MKLTTEYQELKNRIFEKQTTGVRLKYDLGLTDVKDVVICRVQGSPIKLYYVWYDTDSRIPLNRNTIESSPVVSRIRVAPELDRDVKMHCFQAIEDFNDSIRDGIFITVDLAGRKLVRDVLR